jgi:hypothetical protein
MLRFCGFLSLCGLLTGGFAFIAAFVLEVSFSFYFLRVCSSDGPCYAHLSGWWLHVSV